MAFVEQSVDVKNYYSKSASGEYDSFEDFKKELFKNIDEALQEIEEGKGIPMEEAVAELEAKYHLNEEI